LTKHKKSDTGRSYTSERKRHTPKPAEERERYLANVTQASGAGDTDEISEHEPEESTRRMGIPSGEGDRHRIHLDKKEQRSRLTLIVDIIAVIAFIGMVIAAYTNLKFGVAANNDKIDETQTDIRTINQETTNIRERLAKLEVRAELLQINADLLNDLKEEVGELKKQVRNAEKIATKERKALIDAIERRLKVLESKININPR